MNVKTVSVLIPAKNELFLRKTIEDVLKNSRTEIEIIPILDGYEPPQEELVQDPRVRYLRLPPTDHLKKRHAINAAAEIAQGTHIMALDAHCLVSPGFDEVLLRDHQPGTISVLRRYRLDAENWCIDKEKPQPIDYEYLIWPKKYPTPGFYPFHWDKRTNERLHLPTDEIYDFQASMWFMEKEFFKKMGFMQTEGYLGWGNEGEELAFSTYQAGGKVIVNKNAYYAHLRKGRRYGRMYNLNRKELEATGKFAYNYWVHENKDFFIKLMERFGPMPGWPSDWINRLY